MSVRDIAADIGVSHTLVHRYFGTKDEIVAAVLERGDERVAEATRSASIGEIVEGSVSALLDDPDRIRTLAAGLLEGYPLSPLANRAELSRKFTERLSEAQQSGEATLPEGVEPAVAAACGGAAVIGWAVAREYLLHSHNLESIDEQDLSAQITAMLQQMYGLEDA